MHNLEEDYLDIKYLTNRMRQVLYNVLINNYLVGEVEYIIYIRTETRLVRGELGKLSAAKDRSRTCLIIV